MSISNLYTLVEEDFTFSGIHTIFACQFRFMHLESGEKEIEIKKDKDTDRQTERHREIDKGR